MGGGGEGGKDYWMGWGRGGRWKKRRNDSRDDSQSEQVPLAWKELTDLMPSPAPQVPVRPYHIGPTVSVSIFGRGKKRHLKGAVLSTVDRYPLRPIG